jgi:uncharacterized membrane protein (UPF0127 family)
MSRLEILLLVAGIAILIGVLCWFVYPAYFSSVAIQTSQSRACVGGACFRVELATTLEARARGLMYRDHLAPDTGMLFVFEQEGIYPFWMKNMKIPLDMIWIDRDKRIVSMAKNVQPCHTTDCPDIVPGGDALYVLEINAGLADKIGLKVGDYCDIRP